MTFRAVIPCCAPDQPAIPPQAMSALADFCQKVFCCTANAVGELEEHATAPRSTDQTGSKSEPEPADDGGSAALTPEQEKHLFDKMNSGGFVRIDKGDDK